MIGYLVIEKRIDSSGIGTFVRTKMVALCRTPEKAHHYVMTCGHMGFAYQVDEVDFTIKPGFRLMELGDGSLIVRREMKP